MPQISIIIYIHTNIFDLRDEAIKHNCSLSENIVNKSNQSIIIDQSKLTKKLNAQ